MSRRRDNVAALARARTLSEEAFVLLYSYTFIQATHTGSSVHGPGAKAIPQESIHRLISQRGPARLIGHLV